MNVGDVRRRAFLLAAGGLAAGRAAAVDNPDAPDWVGAFEARCDPLEKRVRDAGDPAAEQQARRDYAAFLDRELNEAWRELMRRLDAPSRAALQQSQRRWLTFRDAEAQFIDTHWVRENHGSSSTLSRADHRAAVVKQRVLVLLAYLKEQPAAR